MSDIATKLTYLNTTKQKIKDSINNIGGNITSETPFRQYVAALESIYQSLPKVSGTGTTLSLSPTLKGLMQSTLKGNTSQVQLSGKNLLDDTQWVQNRVINNTSGDITYSQNNASSEQYMAVQPNTTYTFSSALSCRALRVGTYKSDKTFIERKSSSANVSTWTFTTDANTYYLRWNINYNDTTITQDNIDALKLQINSGTERGTYEQYCGGTPSPNPSYPQDIHNVSGNNNIVVCGKNLFDKDNANVINGYIRNEGTNFVITSQYTNKTIMFVGKPNTTYTISKKVTDRFRVGLYNSALSEAGTYDLSSIIRNDSGTKITITTTSTDYYIYAHILETDNLDEVLATIQIEYGSTATTYEAYNGTTYPINLPSGMELSKIGTYQDYIYKDSDKWYLHKEIGKFTYNNEGSVNTPATNYYNVSGLTNQGWINTLNTNTYLANEYPSVSIQPSDGNFQNETQNMSYAFGLHLNGTTIRFKDSRGLSASDFKNDLVGTEIYFALATPTSTEITDTTLIEQLEAIYNAKSKNGTTNINQENNDLPFIIDASCLKGA